MSDMPDLREMNDAATLISRADPEPVREHWVEVDGTLYPPKQAYHLLTGFSRSEYNTDEALTQLRKRGFATGVTSPDNAPEAPATATRKTTNKPPVKKNPSSAAKTPSTWRVCDGSAVESSDALIEWSAAAHQVLEATAGRYNDFVTHKELSDKVQEVSGVRTRMQMRNWIDRILGAVVDECARRNQPPLTSLCVTQNHTMGEGYRYVLETAGEPIPDDLDRHAAEARLRCHRTYATDLPRNGGVPTLPKQVATARALAARKAMAARVEQIELCPVHRTALPRNGECDYCA